MPIFLIVIMNNYFKKFRIFAFVLKSQDIGKQSDVLGHDQSVVQRKCSFAIRLIYRDFNNRMRHRFPLQRGQNDLFFCEISFPALDSDLNHAVRFAFEEPVGFVDAAQRKAVRDKRG